ncbi:MAG TPA: hypothetical protein VGF56_07580 [Rhizomicrobium sp.]|jgi:hypothetical protein
MSEWKSEIARRPFLAGLFALLGLSVVGGTVYEAAHILRRRYPPTAFDDLLDQIPDRDSAVKVGEWSLAHTNAFDVSGVAQILRKGIGKQSLPDVLGAEAAQGRLTEISGWLMPTTLTLLCELAAS